MAAYEISGWVDGKCVIRLGAPIETERGQITHLTLRDANAADIMTTGNPVSVLPEAVEPGYEVDGPRMAALMAELAGIGEGEVSELSAHDFIRISHLIEQLPAVRVPELVDICIELGLVYHTNPFEFMSKGIGAVGRTYESTQRIMARMRSNQE